MHNKKQIKLIPKVENFFCPFWYKFFCEKVVEFCHIYILQIPQRRFSAMKEKRKWIKRVYTVSGVSLIMILCLCLGAEFEQSMRQRDENMQTVTQIAVVNMDTGVIRNGELLNYAAGLIRFPDTNFTYTSLEMARTGIVNGSYAAYVIIPEGFSACAVSVEAEPEEITIQYAVNENLREDIYNEIMKDIHDFEITLNANLSYMYVSAILEEFHKGQDAAVTIMASDEKEMKLIQGIDAKSLIGQLELTETEYPENELEYTDLSEEVEKNKEYLDKINEYQQTGLEQGQAEFEKIKEADEVWQAAFQDISATLEGIEITKDEDGNLVYQEGMESLGQIIEEYKVVLEEEKLSIMTQIGWEMDEQGVGSVSGNEVVYDEIDRTINNRIQFFNEEMETVKEEIGECIGRVHVDVSGNMVGMEELQDAVDKIPEFTYDSKDISAGVLEEWQNHMIDEVLAMSIPDTEEWTNVFQEEIVDRVLEEAEKENEVLKRQSVEAAEAMNDYETVIGEFDPFQFMETEQLMDYFNELNSNIYDMEDEINESTMEKEEYVTALYGAVLENEFTLRESLDQTFALTSGNVENMVEGLKQNRAVMNEANTGLLLEFSNQLPYTRLGKVEYTRMYDFVSHPLETQDLSTEDIKALHNRNYETPVLAVLGILIFWLAAGGIYYIFFLSREESKSDK